MPRKSRPQLQSQGSEMEKVYKTKIRYKCPKRGWVEEEVEVKRYKSTEPPEGYLVDVEAIDVEVVD